ncbi:MAG TPA: cohesin domain-containing protein, partial [Thermoanaerobaculia bacterium]|nr:cohesin domain-containing protein [Thermoanaerobaculia bacterium]
AAPPQAVDAPVAAGEAAARVWLAPARLAVAPGDRFEVRVQAAAARPVSHLPITLEYDPEVLAVEAIEREDFLGGVGEAQLLSESSTPGRIVLGASRLGKVAGVRGAGTVARITFRAVAAGTTALAFRDSRALGADLQPLTPFTADSARVEVRAVPPIELPRGKPEPVPTPERPRS